MNCIQHHQKESVGLCKTCGAPLCGECLKKYSGNCVSCTEEMVKKLKKSRMRMFVVSALLLIGGIVLGIEMWTPDEGIGYCLARLLMVSVTLAFVPFGWKALNFSAGMFMFIPVAGWVFYFLIKGALALMIGWIIGIPKLVTGIRDYRSALRVEKRLKEEIM